MILPIESSALWYSKDLEAREDWRYQLTKENIIELENAWQQVQSLDISQINCQNFALPEFAKVLYFIRNFLETGPGVFLIKGFPTDNYKENDLKRIFWGVVNYIGTPISQSATGERVFSVRHEGYQQSDSKARGPNTNNKLSFHTDRCDVISFMCLQQAKSGGENLIVSSIAVHNEILKTHPDLLETLYQPFYYKRHNVDSGNKLSYCQMPIFAVYQNHFAANIMRILIYRAYTMEEIPDMTSKQQEALELIETIAADPKMHIQFTQQPGDILLVNNFVTFHSRTAFEDYEDPQLRRHLLRIWLSVPNSRPLSPLFAPNYGNTEAGALRGGMKPLS